MLRVLQSSTSYSLYPFSITIPFKFVLTFWAPQFSSYSLCPVSTVPLPFYSNFFLFSGHHTHFPTPHAQSSAPPLNFLGILSLTLGTTYIFPLPMPSLYYIIAILFKFLPILWAPRTSPLSLCPVSTTPLLFLSNFFFLSGHYAHLPTPHAQFLLYHCDSIQISSYSLGTTHIFPLPMPTPTQLSSTLNPHIYLPITKPLPQTLNNQQKKPAHSKKHADHHNYIYFPQPISISHNLYIFPKT